MKKSLIILVFVLIASFVYADVYVNGYYRSNGTYVSPHYRSNPDGNVWNNWSTRGNINPYTGQRGYKNPYPSGSLFNNSNSFGNTYKSNSLWR
ncbi:hypothetical protein [Deferribacter autotrophicus]|uniref:hypothetical protein n=1 Tax=Deferribacter autotrophicus TaxID=500465 RepID=UPI001CAA8655|nr:hypothetical protein [Deferribacter autotrophicus]